VKEPRPKVQRIRTDRDSDVLPVERPAAVDDNFEDRTRREQMAVELAIDVDDDSSVVAVLSLSRNFQNNCWSISPK
jgi:hypothetical protein